MNIINDAGIPIFTTPLFTREGPAPLTQGQLASLKQIDPEAVRQALVGKLSKREQDGLEKFFLERQVILLRSDVEETYKTAKEAREIAEEARENAKQAREKAEETSNRFDKVQKDIEKTRKNIEKSFEIAKQARENAKQARENVKEACKIAKEAREIAVEGEQAAKNLLDLVRKVTTAASFFCTYTTCLPYSAAVYGCQVVGSFGITGPSLANTIPAVILNLSPSYIAAAATNIFGGGNGMVPDSYRIQDD